MSESSLALYIHSPFCKIKCPYCDFNSYKREKVNQSHWMEAYLKALELWSSKLKQSKISSIFFGGGTPSLMDPNFVALLLQKTDNLWGISSDCEVTIEANPNSVSNIKFKALRNVGINRVSVGVQALNNKDLNNLGRDHDKNQAIRALQIVEKRFKNYNIDFIYGRQYQSTSEWNDELSKIIALQAPHLSLYTHLVKKLGHIRGPFPLYLAKLFHQKFFPQTSQNDYLANIKLRNK